MDLRTLLVLLAICTSVQSQFPNGATVEECVTLAPAGITDTAGQVPFIIATSVTQYTPGTSGSSVTVIFFSPANSLSDVQGFVLQARRASPHADSTPVGTFDLLANGDSRLLNCGSPGDTITNIDSSIKTFPLIFTWNPPADNYGEVRFIGSLSSSSGEFWGSVTPATSLTSSAGNPFSINSCPSPIIEGSEATWTPPTCFRGNDLLGSATCNPSSGSSFPLGSSTATCTCSDGGDIATCDIQVEITADPCSPNPCPNGQICSSDASGFTCTAGGDPCTPTPCQNGGTCLVVSTDIIPQGFFCQCPAGLPQPMCGDVCLPNPCQNGGTCFANPSSSTGFTCNCLSGFPQPTCTGDVCLPNPCQNGGTCFANPSSSTGFTCNCLSGFPQPTCTGDVCLPNPCQNGGTCFANPSSSTGFTCNCLSGFPQPTCTVDACSPNPCQNGGSCLLDSTSASGFRCNCLPPFLQLPLCTAVSPTDPCFGDPCSGNECRVTPSSLAGYTCHSVTGTPCVQ